MVMKSKRLKSELFQPRWDGANVGPVIPFPSSPLFSGNNAPECKIRERKPNEKQGSNEDRQSDGNAKDPRRENNRRQSNTISNNNKLVCPSLVALLYSIVIIEDVVRSCHYRVQSRRALAAGGVLDGGELIALIALLSSRQTINNNAPNAPSFLSRTRIACLFLHSLLYCRLSAEEAPSLESKERTAWSLLWRRRPLPSRSQSH